MKKTGISILLLAALLPCCKKDPKETTPPVTTGSLRMEFENMVDTNELVLNSVNYVNAHNDTFTISKFKYYISNIQLTKSDGTVFSETESYHLIDEAVLSSKTFTIANVPYGDYTAVSFMIGVDPARNTSGIQSGALDPGLQMFWNWNTGYIMAKMEGHSPQSGDTINHNLVFHMGGFSGTNNVLKTVHPSFNGAIAGVSGEVTPEIHLKADVLEWFKSPINVSFDSLYFVMDPGTKAKLIADNYADMFSVEHIHN